jgi:predicted kinase
MIVYFLVGLPGSGKSTWAKNNKDKLEASVISTDYFIEQEALRKNKEYSEVYPKFITQALDLVNKSLKYSVKNKKNIILDQTNLSRKARIDKLKSIPKGYTKVCVFFPAPKDLEERLLKRKGREISPTVIKRMQESLEIPLKKEGWDKVIIIGVNDGC